MIYDIFMFNGEFDILDIRLNMLKDSVDGFIIIEAPKTFSSLPKPLYFLQVKDKYKELPIKYYVVEAGDKELEKLAKESPNTKGAAHWLTEFYQKESIKKALTHLKDEDICFVSDCDEIWNPEVLPGYLAGGIYRIAQTVSVYYVNLLSSERWAGTLLCRYKDIKDSCLNHLRTQEHATLLEGWHFTNMGGVDMVRRKLNDSYTSDSYNTPEVQAKLAERFGKSDYMGRDFKFKVDDSRLPKYLLTNKEKYGHLFI